MLHLGATTGTSPHHAYVCVRRKSVRTSREAEPAKSQSSPKENNPPRPTANAQLASPIRLGRGIQKLDYFNDKGNRSNAQKNGSRSSRSTPEYNADAVSYYPNPRKRSAARESEFQEPLADKQFSDRAGGARRAKASSGGPPGKDPEFWRENLLSHEAGLARRSSSQRLFNPDTDNPSNTTGRNKARESTAARRIYDQRTSSDEAGLARSSSSKRLFNPDTDKPGNTPGRNAEARRMYDQRIHVFRVSRSRKAPSSKRYDIRQQKIISNLSRKPPRKEAITTRRDLPMIIEGRAITAMPDTGGDGDFISSQLASELQIPIRKGKSDRKSFRLGNGKFMKAIGRIKASCAFAKDSIAGTMERWFYVVDDLAVPMIMGSPFLEETKTLSEFTHRLEERSPCADNLPLVNLISSCKRSKNRLNAFINGRSTQVCADTGSELDLMSPAHAKAQRYKIDRRAECRKRVRLANNTIAETIGQVKVALSLDNNKSDAGISRVFDILPGLPCGVLLGVDTLTETEAFTTHASWFVEIPSGSQDEPLMLHLITWVGMKVCAIERFFSRRRRRRLGGGTGDLLQPEPSAIKKRDNYLSDSLPESDSDDTLESLQQGYSRGSDVGVDKIIRIILSREGLQVPYIHEVLS